METQVPGVFIYEGQTYSYRSEDTGKVQGESPGPDEPNLEYRHEETGRTVEPVSERLAGVLSASRDQEAGAAARRVATAAIANVSAQTMEAA